MLTGFMNVFQTDLLISSFEDPCYFERLYETINEVAETGIQYDVQRFDGLSWTKIGELSQAHATSYSVNSGKIVNGYAFIGEE